MNKRGLSEVVVTILIILLAIAAISVVWVTVNNIIKNQTSKSSACFSDFEDIQIDEKYTCVNLTSNKIELMIQRGDIELESIQVSISGEEKQVDFYIVNQEIPVTSSVIIGLLKKNSAKKYSIDLEGFGNIESISIARINQGQTCSIADTIFNVPEC